MANGAKLVIVEGALRGRAYPLDEGAVTIGRLAENTIAVDDPSVSRSHARLEKTDGGYEIRDLGSYNGVNIRGDRVDRAELHAGDTFRLGDVKFQLVADAPAPAAAPEPAAAPPPAPPPAAGAEGTPIAAPAVAEPAPEPYGAGAPAPAQGLAPAPGMPGELDPLAPPGEGLPAEAGEAIPQRKGRMMAGTVGGLLFAAAAAIYFLMPDYPPVRDAVLLKKGEERLVLTAPGPGGREVVFDAAYPLKWVGEGEERRLERVGGILDAKRFEKDIVYLRAREEDPDGTEVYLRRGGKTVEILTVIVRGHLEKPLGPDVEHLSSAERKRMARQLVEEAKAARATHVYTAVEKCREAIAVTRSLPLKPAVQVEAEDLLKDVEKDLAARYDDHRFRAGNLINMNEYKQAAKELLLIKELIPDPADLRHQKAKLYYEKIKRKGLLRG